MLTDPPYNVAYTGKTKDKLTIQNDNMDEERFVAFLESAFACADNVLDDGGVFYIWHADSHGNSVRSACKTVGWEIRECLVWVKNHFVLGRQDYQWKHEPCLYGWKKGTHKWYGGRDKTTVLEYAKPHSSHMHPTMKPIELLAEQIQNSSLPGDIILDLFGGSGSTLIACEQLNRKCYMMELDPKYIDTIINRWETFTGKKAVKVNGD